MSQEMKRGVNMLEVHVNMMGREGVLHPTLIVDGENVILVDTGLPGQLATIREAMQQQTGIAFERINQVILTHHDIDHLGGLRELLKELPSVHVLAHTQEKAYIEGQKRPLKLAKMEDNLENLPEATKSFYPILKRSFENATAPVNETVEGGEELPYCGGIIVVFTPGHTLGHMSLYVKETKTLIAGDALTIQEGNGLDLAPAANNHDMGLCRQSMKTLMGYDIEAVICYHGGLYQGNVNQRIAELANA